MRKTGQYAASITLAGSIRVELPNQFCPTLGPSSPPASQEMVLVGHQST